MSTDDHTEKGQNKPFRHIRIGATMLKTITTPNADYARLRRIGYDYRHLKETGMIILDRILYTSTHYPANYGFIPKTLADDHDPLDVLVLCSEALDPLTLVKCFPIGLVKMIDNYEIDEKIIAIPD